MILSYVIEYVLNTFVKMKIWIVGGLQFKKKATKLKWVSARKTPTKFKARDMCEPLLAMNVLRGKYTLLEMGLYVLRQAARQRNMNMNTFILSIKFTRLLNDSNMNVRESYALGTLVIIIVYVDDMDTGAQSIKCQSR